MPVMGRENLLEFFLDYFASDREYLVYDDGYRWWRYTHRQILNRAVTFAGRLKQAGVGKGDRVLVWSESRPEWIVAFWGSLLMGAVVVPIGAESSLEFARKVQAIVQPKVIAVGEDVSWDFDVRTAWRLTDENWGQSTPIVPSREVRAGDLAEIVFTSGSTGDPKGVEITHGNLLSQVEAAEPALKIYRKVVGPFFSPRLLQLLPLSHMFGQITTLGLPPLLSASVVLTRRQSPAALVRLIHDRHINAAVCVPRLLGALRNQIAAWAPEAAGAERDRSSILTRLWRYRRIHRMFGWRFLGFVPGGAPLDPALENFWSGLGFLVMQGYGLTETSPVVTLNHPLRSRKGSVGRPLPGVEVRTAGDGEILVHGPNVTPGYYGQPDRTSEVVRNGWFHTGDLGQLDREGYLYVRGRKKEMIVTGEGLNVFPEDVERVLNRLPGVRESAVIGLPAESDGAGEQVHAVLVLDPGVESAQIVASANRQLEAPQRIRSISVWPESSLPRTPETGKLRRAEIRDRLAQQLTGQPREAVFRETQECRPEIVMEEMERRTGRKVAAGARLDELGLSSVDRVELMLEIERVCKREIDEAEIAEAQTVDQLQEIIQRALSSREELGIPSGLERSQFPVWNRNYLSRAVRNLNLALWILPVTRMLAKPIVSGTEKLSSLRPPVIFAANHQSHVDTPLIFAALPARWRYRVAPAMYKEYFAAYFNPKGHPLGQRLGIALQYYLVALLFNGFPIPQQEAGVLDSLRYAGDLVSDGWSLLIYPEGERRPTSQMGEFQPGVGFLATRLNVPVVPIHLEGIDRVLPRERMIPRFATTRVTFGDPMRLRTGDPGAVARQLEETVQAL